MRRFAEDEIVIPNGPKEGRRFRCAWQPYTRLWFDAVDSGRWSRLVATGPTQSGKTLCAFVIPLLYHLFEVRETVICGLPDMDMATDKWREDILPVIERTRYRELLPRRGAGSQGGRPDAIQFVGGASTLKFMSGGGGDKSRAGFTGRVVVITETDGMDVTAEASHETDKVTQLEARTRAYGSRRRIYMECTVTVADGRTWRECDAGTRSRIALPCPRCGAWILPTLDAEERDLVQGWRDADTVLQARSAAMFCCPHCGQGMTEAERAQANMRGVLLHGAQRIGEAGEKWEEAQEKEVTEAAADTEGGGKDGRLGKHPPRYPLEKDGRETALVTGAVPETDTLGFRWSAVNNLFVTAADVAADEWRASRDVDEDDAEREMRQYVWCLPYEPPEMDTTPLSSEALMRRTSRLPRGVVPEEAEYLTVGVDLGKWLCHYAVVAWRPEGAGHVVDYGRFEVATDQLGLETAMVAALREFRDLCVAGWAHRGSTGAVRVPDQVWIDSGWQSDVVYAFCRESTAAERATAGHERFRPCKGYGATQDRLRRYSRPKRTSTSVRFIGEEFHISRLQKERTYLVEINADSWKTWVHRRLSSPVDAAGAMTLYDAPANDHRGFCKHLTAEREVQVFVPDRGMVTTWKQTRKNNHWLDAVSLASAAGHFCGVRVVEERGASAGGAATREGTHVRRVTTPDGRPYLVTERR
ncbi:MAG: terminase gpA endonuclease subunit [Phycisphaerae bacterium]